MPIEFNAQADIAEVVRMLDATQRRAVPKATSAALNRTASYVRTRVRREVAKQMGLKQKDIQRSITVKRSTTRLLIAAIIGSGKAIPLIRFKGTRQGAAGVRTQAYGATRVLPGTFIAMSRQGGKQVWKRTGKKRLPIKVIMGPSVPATMANDAVERLMVATAAARFRIEIERALRFYLSRP